MAEKGFYGSLLDFSFESFVFPKIIRVLYAFAVVVICIGYIAGIAFAFRMGSLEGIAAVVLGPVVMTIYLILIRVWMEVAIILFRIYDNTNVIAGK